MQLNSFLLFQSYYFPKHHTVDNFKPIGGYVSAPPISRFDIAHTSNVLRSSQLHWSTHLAVELERPWLALLPGFLSRCLYFDHARQQVGAVLLASHIALSKKQTTIVLGCARTQSHTLSSSGSGGSSGKGSGGVVLPDMGIAVRLLCDATAADSNAGQRILIVDATPQMAIGVSHDFYTERCTNASASAAAPTEPTAPRIFIVDMYSTELWPYDPVSESKDKDTANINLPWSSTSDKNKILDVLGTTLQTAIHKFQPTLILARIGMEENVHVNWTAKDIATCWKVVTQIVSTQQLPLVLLLGEDVSVEKQNEGEKKRVALEIVTDALSFSSVEEQQEMVSLLNEDDDEEERRKNDGGSCSGGGGGNSAPREEELVTQEVQEEEMKLEELADDDDAQKGGRRLLKKI